MEIIILENKQELAKAAAHKAASYIRKAIVERGESNIIVATGASQIEVLEEFVKEDIDWSVVTAFHLDEYVGMAESHPASFRKYLKERFVDLVPLREFHYVDGETDPDGECTRLGKIISRHPIDVAFVGIGENGHLAFNDPPADFETEEPYHVVNLNDACRRQQLGEGWFPTFDDVPERAISMTIKQIMKTKALICSVPDQRKAKAVYDTLNCEISPDFPASVMRNHPETILFLEPSSASLL